MIYELTDEDRAYVQQVAQRMEDFKRRGGAKSNRYDRGKSELELHELGVASELAFSKMTGLKPNFDLTYGGDGGVDFTTAKGLTVSLKYRHSRNRDFAIVAPTLDGFRADIGVLIWPFGSSGYEFVGWTTRVHAAQVGMTVKLKADRFLVRWRDLLSPAKFMELLAE